MSHRALVFHTIHDSFVDGYGTRNTVFLKGCPLKYVWCCNPERQSFQPELKVNQGQCNGYGNCLNTYSRNALSPVGGLVQVNRDICGGRVECVEHCYTSTLELFDIRCTAREIFGIVRDDRMFYKDTGGGIIIGGGGCTYYPGLILELTQLCHDSGIHTAMDTCSYATSSKASEALRVVDLLLFDIKGIGPMCHKKNVGRSNEIILQNLHLLSEMREPVITRVPVIPEYNDSDEELNNITDLLSILKSAERVGIPSKYEFSRIKYEQLDLEYRLKPYPVNAERQDAIRVVFEAKGLHTQIGG